MEQNVALEKLYGTYHDMLKIARCLNAVDMYICADPDSIETKAGVYIYTEALDADRFSTLANSESSSSVDFDSSN